MSLEIFVALNERAGCGLELVGLIEQGQSGAAYVRWPDGREAVVTTAFATIDHMRQTAEVLAEVRALGSLCQPMSSSSTSVTGRSRSCRNVCRDQPRQEPMSARLTLSSP